MRQEGAPLARMPKRVEAPEAAGEMWCGFALRAPRCAPLSGLEDDAPPEPRAPAKSRAQSGQSEPSAAAGTAAPSPGHKTQAQAQPRDEEEGTSEPPPDAAPGSGATTARARPAAGNESQQGASATPMRKTELAASPTLASSADGASAEGTAGQQSPSTVQTEAAEEKPCGTEVTAEGAGAGITANEELDALLAYMSLQALSTEKAGTGPSLIVEGKLGAHTVNIMIDTGANADYIAESRVKKLGLTWQRSPRTVNLADGHQREASGSVVTNLQMGLYRESWPLHVIPLHLQNDGVDVILGTNWQAKHHAVIRTAERDMSFEAPSVGRLTVYAGKHEPDYTLISALQLASLLENDGVEEMWLCLIRPQAEAPSSGEESTSKPGDEEPFSVKLTAHISDPKWRVKVRALLEEFADVFRHPETLPSDHGGLMHRIIEKPGSKPPARPGYRMSLAEYEECKRQLIDLLKRGYIRHSTSEYAAPVLFIRKHDGSLRMCIDYRALNAQTVRDRYPLARIDSLIERLVHSTRFSTFDMDSGYWQQLVHPDDVHKTAFITPFGLFEWLVLPFGLTGAPSSFSRLVSGKVFPQLVESHSTPWLTYLDDIAVHSQTDEQHFLDLRSALERLRKFELFLKPKKCQIWRDEIQWLGYVIKNGTVRCQTAKQEAVRDWPTPKNLAELLSFLGLAGFYHKFVPRFAHIAAPMNDLKKAGVPFIWGPLQQRAFEELKTALTSAPVLHIPDPERPFVLHVDASGFAIGGALMQDFGQGLQPVAFASRKLKDAETRYAPHDKEMLAGYSCLEEWQHLLRGSPGVTVYSDHHSLQHFFSQPHLNQRQLRWKDFLDDLHPEIKYIKGQANVVADALSRNPLHLNALTLAPIAHVVATAGDVTAAFKAGYTSDLVCRELIKNIQAGLQEGFSWQDGYLYTKDGRLYVPNVPGLRQRLLSESHDIPIAGHLGRDKNTLPEQFYWPGMWQDIREYIRTCPLCQQAKASNRKPAGLLQPLAVPSAPFEQIGTDFITGLPKSEGCDAVMTFVDRLTKAVHFVPCTKTVTAKQAARLFFNNIFRIHGMPKVIVSDRDPRFTSDFWRHLFNLVGTKLAMSTAFHAATDGQTERAQRSLEDMLRTFVNPRQDNWVALLPALEFAYNNSVNASTQEKPFFMLYGRRPYTPPLLIGEEELPPSEGRRSLRAASYLEELRHALTDAKAQLERAQARQKAYADRSRREATFAAGDQVMLDSEHLRLAGIPGVKLSNPWEGPFKILEMVHPLAARLDLPPTLQIHPVVHVSRLKHFFSGEERFPGRAVALNPPPVKLIEGQEAYEVDCFLRERRPESARHTILVKWTGYSAAHAEWRPARELKKDLGTEAYEEMLEEMRAKPLPQRAQTRRRKPPQR